MFKRVSQSQTLVFEPILWSASSFAIWNDFRYSRITVYISSIRLSMYVKIPRVCHNSKGCLHIDVSLEEGEKNYIRFINDLHIEKFTGKNNSTRLQPTMYHSPQSPVTLTGLMVKIKRWGVQQIDCWPIILHAFPPPPELYCPLFGPADSSPILRSTRSLSSYSDVLPRMCDCHKSCSAQNSSSPKLLATFSQV